jgi:hypothetical protein
MWRPAPLRHVSVARRGNSQRISEVTIRWASIGIDIGKEVFHVVGFGTDGKIAWGDLPFWTSLLICFDQPSTLSVAFGATMFVPGATPHLF